MASREGTFSLLLRPDFRNFYFANVASELGDSLHYIALMWFALELHGTPGVIAVRLADTIPALVFGFQGGLAADRWNRKRLMISMDVVRALVLLPIAIAGLTHHLTIWVLAFAAFVLESATSYFEPASGAILPSLVERTDVQRANGLVNATAHALSIGGWALSAGLVAFLPISAFFGVNSLSFATSALFLTRIDHKPTVAPPHQEQPTIRQGFAALKGHRELSASIIVLGLAVTISSGAWIGGLPDLVRTGLHQGAGGFSIVMIGYAVGAIAAGAVLTRWNVKHKARASFIAWILCLPGYLLLAYAHSLYAAIFGAFCVASAHAAAWVLIPSAAQQTISDDVLGRIMGLISLVNRGAHALGLLLIAPLFAIMPHRIVFIGVAVSVALVGISGALIATTRRTPLATDS